MTIPTTAAPEAEKANATNSQRQKFPNQSFIIGPKIKVGRRPLQSRCPPTAYEPKLRHHSF